MTGDRAANIGKVVAEASSATGTIDALLVGGVELKSLLDAKALYGPLVGVIPESDKLDGKLSKVQEGYATDGYLVPVYRNQTGFVYDPEKVPNPPQSWAEFTAWLDANPGQFAFNDPSKGGSGQAFVQAAIINILGDEASNMPATPSSTRRRSPTGARCGTGSTPTRTSSPSPRPTMTRSIASTRAKC